MHDPAQFARKVGGRLAQAAADASLQVEGTAATSAIYAHPVQLSPIFVALDPRQTWVDRERHRAIPAAVQPEWSAHRLLIPSAAADGLPAGALHAGLAGVAGPLSFEAVLTHGELLLFLAAPPEQLGFYASAWQVAYPDGMTLSVEDPLAALPVLPVILDLYAGSSYDRQIIAPVSFWGQCLRLATLLNPGDLLLYQVLFTPVRDPWQRNIAILSQGHRSRTETKNLNEPLFAAVVRIGTTNLSLATSLSSLVGNFTSGGVPFQYRSHEEFDRVLAPMALQNMFRSRCSYSVGQLMTSGELEHFIHPPTPDVAGTLRMPLLHGLRVPERLRHDGIPLGVNRNRGEAIPVQYPWKEEYSSHRAIVGTSTKGKSAALANWLRSLAEQGAGCCFIDPHRRTAELLIGTLGDVRDRVVYLDFDAPTPVAYNPFRGVMPEDYGRFTLDFVQTIKPLFETEGYFRLNHIIANGIYGLFVLGMNLATLPALYERTREGEALRSRIISAVQNDAVRRFWRDEYPSHAASVFAPIQNRFMPLFLEDRTYRTFAQQASKVDIPACIHDGRIVIVSMPSSVEAARLLGGFLIGQCKHTALRRNTADQQFFLVVDEFHRFGGAAFHEILDQTAKGRFSLWLVHQTTSQIPSELAKSIMGIDTFVFGVNGQDAKHYTGLFGGRVGQEVLANLPTGAVYARIGEDVVNFDCPSPLVPDAAVAAEIIVASRAQYYEAGPVQPVVASHRSRIIETFE